MKPAPFDYVAAANLPQALALLSELPEPTVLAGGQSLIPMMNMRLARPRTIVDLNRLDDLSGVSIDRGLATIGAMTRHSQLAAHPELGRCLPALVTAVNSIGYQAIRHRGTIGGSLAHGDPAAELPTVMLALDATIELRSVAGARSVAVADFFLGYYETARRPDEMVTSVSFHIGGDLRLGFAEFSRRPGDFAIALAAVTTGERGVRVVVGGLDTRPMRIPGAEEGVGSARFRAEQSHVAEVTSPSSDIHGSADYRIRLATELINRAIPDGNRSP